MKRGIIVGTLAAVASLLTAGSALAIPKGGCIEEQEWQPGWYTNANEGDAVAIQTTASSFLAPIMSDIGEIYSHILMVTWAGGTFVSENIGDPNTLQGGSCDYPISASSLQPMSPGILEGVYADGTGTGYNELSTGEVLVGAGHPYGAYCVPYGNTGDYTCSTICSPSSPRGAHYYLASYTGAVPVSTAGMCSDFVTDYCGVARPAPKSYPASEIYASSVYVYNAAVSMCNSQASIIDSIGCALEFESVNCSGAGNQVVNTFLYADPGSNASNNWSKAVTTVVSPDRIASMYTGTKVPVTWHPGYYHEVTICY
jgi:hypothetical protein